MTNASDDRLLTVAEAADRMSVGEHYVRRLIFQRRIPFTKFGEGKNAPVRIATSDVEAFLAAARVEAAQ